MVTATKQIHGIPTTAQENEHKAVARNQPFSFSERLASYFQWENLTVAGREVKGFVVHPIIATAILGAMITFGFTQRSELNWQHDQLVILATQKEDAEKAAKQEHDDRANQDSADKAWREKMTNQMNELKFVVQNTTKPGGRN